MRAALSLTAASRFVPTDAEGILAQYRELVASAASNALEKRFLADLLARKAFALPDEQEARLCSIIRRQAARRLPCAV